MEFDGVESVYMGKIWLKDKRERKRVQGLWSG